MDAAAPHAMEVAKRPKQPRPRRRLWRRSSRKPSRHEMRRTRTPPPAPMERRSAPNPAAPAAAALMVASALGSSASRTMKLSMHPGVRDMYFSSQLQAYICGCRNQERESTDRLGTLYIVCDSYSEMIRERIQNGWHTGHTYHSAETDGAEREVGRVPQRSGS